MTDRFTDTQKHSLEQYNRMQDILTSTSNLAIKFMGVVGGGALVSLGAAIIKLKTEMALDEVVVERLQPIYEVLSDAFQTFGVAMIVMFFTLVPYYFSRYAYLMNVDTENSNTNNCAERIGSILEGITIILYLSAGGILIKAFYDLIIAV